MLRHIRNVGRAVTGRPLLGRYEVCDTRERDEHGRLVHDHDRPQGLTDEELDEVSRSEAGQGYGYGES